MKHIYPILVIIWYCYSLQCLLPPFHSPLESFDVTIQGPIAFADGIGRQSIGVIDCLKNDLRINFIHSRYPYPVSPDGMTWQDVPAAIHAIIQEQRVGHSNVLLFEDILGCHNLEYFKKMPTSTIKLAYTMYEATYIPQTWVTILNTFFDAAVVPDEWLVDVYKNSGVHIPIFVLPLGVYLEPFLAKPIKQKANIPFVFGTSATFCDRKNYVLLLKSFADTFGNNPQVFLKIHGRYDDHFLEQLRCIMQELSLQNVEIVNKKLSWHDYSNFMASLDCYILLSKGEGFSVTAREALALGLPCILSDNTAHKTLCVTNFVYAVPSEILEHIPGHDNNAYQYNCTQSDVQKALQTIYHQYNEFLVKAAAGRMWVQQYSYQALKSKYLSLIKPTKVILGDKNYIEDSCLITSDQKLYNKYLTFCSS